MFGYELEEVRKFALAAVGALVLLASFFIAYPVGFEDALGVVVGEVFAVAGVFLAKNHTADDLAKAVQNLAGATIALVAFFETVSPTTEAKVFAIIAQLAVVYGVYKVANDGRGATGGGV